MKQLHGQLKKVSLKQRQRQQLQLCYGCMLWVAQMNKQWKLAESMLVMPVSKNYEKTNYLLSYFFKYIYI
ncbi:MAG: hypothetical protein CL471_05900 [Acidobacteria bacterium]|nr:hypothetical protein [Acidobacteriota bacterium]